MISSSKLEQFGLTDKEAKVYLATLGLGPASVQDIARKVEIHRVSVYDILESLKEKGFISQTINGKKRLVVAIEPEKILDLLKNKEQEFSNLLPELQAIHNKGSHKPKVMYFEGKKAIWNAYLDRIRYKPDLGENLVYGSSEKILTVFPEEYKRFTKERLDKNIRAKIIVEQSKSGQKEASTAKDQLREVKFLPEGKSFKSNTIIYGDRVMIISWESMIAVVIEDKANADNQRFVFNLLWQYLP